MGWRRSGGLGFVILFFFLWFCLFSRGVCYFFGGFFSKKNEKTKKTWDGEDLGGWWGFPECLKVLLPLVENLENPFRKHNNMLRNLNCSLVFLFKFSSKNDSYVIHQYISILLGVSLVAALFSSLWQFVFHVCGQLLFRGSPSDPPLTR